MNLFYQPLLQDGIHFLDATESRHCTKVLRMKAGDKIKVTDGQGFFYSVRITKADASQCLFDIEDSIAEPARNFSIHIAIAPTKNADRIEWFVEKAVEVGVDEITLITCHHSERSHLKLERLQKIAVSAMKQSFKARLPTLAGPVAASQFMRTAIAQSKFIAHVDKDNPDHLKTVATPSSNCLVLIGPEGDFSAEELSEATQLGFKKVSLGQSRLRTETAGLAACHILNLVNTP